MCKVLDAVQERRSRAAGRQTSVTGEGRNGKNDDGSGQWPGSGSPLRTLYLCPLSHTMRSALLFPHFTE